MKLSMAEDVMTKLNKQIRSAEDINLHFQASKKDKKFIC